MTTAPISLSALFPDSDSESTFEEIYEISTVTLNEVTLRIRQFSFHSSNANAIWSLPFFYLVFNDIYQARDLLSCKLHLSPPRWLPTSKDTWTRSCDGVHEIQFYILNFRIVFSVLSLFLKRLLPNQVSVYTSDIDDGGQVEENIRFNHQLNCTITYKPSFTIIWMF